MLRYKRTLKHEQLRQNMIYSLIKKAYGTKYSKTSGNKLKTHSRNCLILPGFVKKNISVYNGHIFNNIDIKVNTNIKGINDREVFGRIFINL